MNSEQREQVAAQLEAVAKRLRAGEDVGMGGDLSAEWVAQDPEDGPEDWPTAKEAAAFAQSAIDGLDAGFDGWAEEMHQIGWGLMVWVERAQAVNVHLNVCPECEGAKVDSDGAECEDCEGSGEGYGDSGYVCDYALKPIPPNAVLYQHKEGPDTIEADGGES